MRIAAFTLGCLLLPGLAVASEPRQPLDVGGLAIVPRLRRQP